MAAGAINVRVMNAPASTTASASRNSQGGFDIEVLLGQVDSYIGGQVASGRGSTYAAMGSRFGLRTRCDDSTTFSGTCHVRRAKTNLRPLSSEDRNGARRAQAARRTARC